MNFMNTPSYFTKDAFVYDSTDKSNDINIKKIMLPYFTIVS